MRSLRAFALGVFAACAAAAHADGHGRGCQTHSCDVRVAHKTSIRKKRAIVRPHRAWLLQTAGCESGGRWHVATGNGFYGGLQFTVRSWRAVGGHGMPHQATRLEQLYRGVLLLRAQGPGAWPVCGRHA
jgi:hypothetical protein